MRRKSDVTSVRNEDVRVICAIPENQHFVYAKTKTQISCAVSAQLISAFVFAT